jgi:hypothetical protein
MRMLATAHEFESLMACLDHLDHLDRERKAAIGRLVFEVVADCPRCERSVRRCDGRRLVDDRLFHRGCLVEDGGP